MDNIKCQRCKRELKTEESIKRKFGKCCYEKIFGKQEKIKVRGYFY